MTHLMEFHRHFWNENLVIHWEHYFFAINGHINQLIAAHN